MKLDAYDALVARLECHARTHPRLFRWEVLGWTLLGYGFLLTLLLTALILGLLFGALMVFKPSAVTIKFGLLLGLGSLLLAWSILRSLWVRLTPPEGIEITAAQAPELFAEIRRLCQELHAPMIHRVVVDDRINASMSQLPRLGILGWSHNHLTLGLPLMRMMTPGEFRSVLAHELGHASGGHGRFGAWIYRIRTTWIALAERVDQGGANAVIRHFLVFFLPRFNARTFVLARQQEYEADRAAVRSAGMIDATNGLIRVAELARQVQEVFWSRLERRPLREAEPPQSISSDMRMAVGEVDVAQGTRWLAEAWARPTDRVDTHPCLRDRLQAMGRSDMPLTSLGLPVESAAVHYLRGFDQTLGERLDRAWHERVRASWIRIHREADGLRTEHATLQAKEVLTTEERWRLAQATMRLDGDAAARSHLDILAEQGHDQGQWNRGRLLLEAGDEQGLADLIAVCARDPDAIPVSVQAATGFLANRGRVADITTWERMGEEYAMQAENARLERLRRPNKKALCPHSLTPEQLAVIRTAVQRDVRVAEAWITRVEVKHLPKRTWHVLVVKPVSVWWKFRTEAADLKLSKALAQAMDVPLAITVFTGRSFRDLAQASQAIPGAGLIDRDVRR